ncbi:hypothetical protein [Sphingomonas sp. ID0503]|uniref:hypothetical protein n=1 Tax=Sphingomonas sp. ID0503 TaxID=3399691 RepID=UPI003AFA3BBD
MDYAEVLRVEAQRCERLALGIADHALARQMLQWAAEYRARSDALRTVLDDLLDDGSDAVQQAA